MSRALSLNEAFYSRILKTTTCWFWIGRKDKFGYGQFNHAGRHFYAHRFAYELVHGSIGDDLTLDHKCRVPQCVNPDHVEPCSNGENVRRRNLARSRGGFRPNPIVDAPDGRTIEEAFYSLILRTTTCWFWIGRLDKNGYGRLCFAGRHRLAHVLAWERFRGPVSAGLVLDHLCRVPRCVNPDHLEPVTQLVNVRRGWQATKTHCVRGHEFTAGNTAYTKLRTRRCKQCEGIRSEASARRRGIVPNSQRTKGKQPNYKRDYDRARYAQKSAEIKATVTKYRMANRETLLARGAERRKRESPEARVQRLAYFAEWQKKHPRPRNPRPEPRIKSVEEKREYSRLRYAATRVKRLAAAAKFRKANRATINAKQQATRREK